MNPDDLITLGDAVKALDDEGKIGGYLIRFGSPDEPDLQGDFFTKATDLGLDYTTATRAIFHHAGDPTLAGRRLGILSLKADAIGVWAEGVLAKSDRYTAAILGMVKAGKLRFSSGTAPHLMTRTPVKGVNRIDCWPIVEASLTPTPVEFRGTGVMSVKALDAAVKGEHLGGHAGPSAAMAALDSLHQRTASALHGHMTDRSKTTPARHRAMKATLAEHGDKALACCKALMDDDEGGDEAATKASERAAWLALHQG